MVTAWRGRLVEGANGVQQEALGVKGLWVRAIAMVEEAKSEMWHIPEHRHA